MSTGETRTKTSRSVQGERRVVTILFCDVAGSTAMAEGLDPEEWAEIMDEAFDVFITPIERYEGTVARLMGDAILAFFGAPTAHEDDPHRAVLAGLDILSGIRPLCEEMKLEYGLDFNVRIGINTGPVVVAEIGSQKTGEYTAMGDAVNLAARMEQSAVPGTIRISEDTYRWIAPLFDVVALGPLEIKGKSEPVNVYQVVDRKAEPGRLRGIEGHRAPLVGRDTEAEKLLEIVTQVQSGRGQILSLIGDAGIGKSRLIEETRALWDQDTSLEKLWVESRGVSFDTTLPYGLFRQLLRHACGSEFDDSPQDVRRKIGNLLDQIPIDVKEEKAKIKQAVEILLEVDEESDHPLPEGEDLKRALYDGICSLFYSLGSMMPAVLVCDDLHWADQASIDLLVYLFELCEQVPLLFLTAFRPYRQSPGWRVKNEAETNFPSRFTHIDLNPLSNADSQALVSNLLTVADLPESLQQKILNKTEGNPFFVEEVVRTLIEKGTVEFDESKGVWIAASQVEEIDIPDNLQALILTRIDRLEREARQTLQLASVIGRSFYYRVLERISEKISGLEKQLNTLERMELIIERSVIPEREYLFRHELTRDAAYKSILRRQRRKFHKNVAEAIELMFADRLDEEAHRLAYHYDQAKDYARALDYYIKAGDKSAALYANAEAVDHYSRAMQIANTIQTTKDTLLHVYSALGRVYEVSGDFENALSVYKTLEARGKEQKDPETILAALIPQATIYSIPSNKLDKKQGREILEKALDLARELGDYRAEAKVLWNMLLLEVMLYGDNELGITYGEQSVAIAREHQLKEELAYALHDLARPYLETGRMDEGWAAFRESNDLWRELNNLPMLADNLGLAGMGSFIMGEFEQAMQRVTEGYEISRNIGNKWGQAYNLATMGYIQMEMGILNQAIGNLTHAVSLARKANFAAGEVMIAGVLSWIYGTYNDIERTQEWGNNFRARLSGIERFEEYRRLWEGLLLYYGGEPEKAASLLDEDIEACCLDVMDEYLGPLLAFLLCTLAFESRDFQTVIRLTDEAIESMHELKCRLFLPDIMMIKGNTLISFGDTQAGINSLNEAYLEAKAIHSKRSAFFITAAWVEAELGRDNPAKAQELRREGREILDFIAGNMDDPKLLAAFLSDKPARTIMGGE